MTIKKIFRKRYIFAVVLIVLIGGIIFFTTRPGPSGIETALAEPATVTNIVSVTGNVAPIAQANFGFQISGIVKSIPVSVGQVVHKGDKIASLDDTVIQASLQSAKAALLVAEANLADSQTTTDIGYSNAKRSALTAVADAYTKVQNAINTSISSLFASPQSANPTLLIPTQTSTSARQLENEQVGAVLLLQEWNAEITTASSSSAEILVTDSQNYLTTITSFVNNLLTAANSFAEFSPPSQTSATTDLATITNANTAIVAATNEVTTAENNLIATRPQSTNALLASIAEAQANVANWQAQANESIVTAPFDGIMSTISPQVGDLVTANTIQFSEISNNLYKVDVAVPDTNIANIALGDPANITLDAFGDLVNFPATVTEIDPAETIIEGVPTYNVTLQFNTPDNRIRSGMTANIDIITESRSNVLAIPFRAISQGGGSTTVRVLNPDGKTWSYVPITTGLKGSNGLIEVHGIATGTPVVTYAPGDNANN